MLVDLHVHTAHGSSDSALPLEELIDESIAAGLDGLTITEHNHLWNDARWDKKALEAGLLVLHGIEVSTDCGHILAYGLEGYVSGIHKAAVLREVADHCGGMLISAHPFRRAFDPGPHIHNLLHLQFPTVEEAAAHPLFELVDAVEVLNGGSTEQENDFARQVAEYIGLPTVGGSDSHSSNSLGHCATRLMVPVRSLPELIEAVRSGHCRPVTRRELSRVP